MYYYKMLDGQIVKSELMLLSDDKPIPSVNPETGETIHYCQQCRRDMGNEYFLGPVCGKCCKANHRKVCH
jgi:hypothetical protein